MAHIILPGEEWDLILEQLKSLDLEDIYYLVSDAGIDTKIALRESIDWLKDGAPDGFALRHFPEWWGRGQQHISFVRSSLS